MVHPGDGDIGLHLGRSERCARASASSVTAYFARRYGPRGPLLPASTIACARASSPDGELALQEWLVGRRAADPVCVPCASKARRAPARLRAFELDLSTPT